MQIYFNFIIEHTADNIVYCSEHHVIIFNLVEESNFNNVAPLTAGWSWLLGKVNNSLFEILV